MILIIFLVCIVGKNQAQSKVGDFITDFYDAKAKSNSSTPALDLFDSLIVNKVDKV